MIEDYLTQLDRELRARRTPRRRFLAEAEDHLRASAAELGDEQEAVKRFGDATTVATGLAQAAAATRVRRSAILVALAFAAYLAAEGVFMATAGPEFADFPQGAPSQLALLSAAAAGLVGLSRRRLRRAAIVVGSASLSAGLVLELAAALTRPAGILPWGELPLVATLFAVASLTSVAAAASAAVAVRMRP